MLLYKKGNKMAKDIEEIIKEIRKEESENVCNLNETQQYLYYNHKRIETEKGLKALGLNYNKGARRCGTTENK